MHQDPVLGYRMGAQYAARVYDAAPARKKRFPLQRHSRNLYSIKALCFSHKKNDFETEKFAIYDAKHKIQMDSNVSTYCTYEGK